MLDNDRLVEAGQAQQDQATRELKALREEAKAAGARRPRPSSHEKRQRTAAAGQGLTERPT